MDDELRFSYNCQFCGKKVKMNTNDIINFIGKNYNTPDGDQLDEFFSTLGKQYNLCPECARNEGFDVEDFEGWEE